MKTNKLIILSGGMDSTTLLHAEKDYIRLALLFNYNQKHKKELQYALASCVELGISSRIIDLTEPFNYIESTLIGSVGEIPNGHYEDITMRKTVVPFRNGIMLSIAAGIAESIGCTSILIGAHKGDHAIYPDCRIDFMDRMSHAIQSGTYSNIFIEAPFISYTKREIALLGKVMGIDYSTTWSCYNGREKHCGTCGTCVERKEALIGFDTTEYEKEAPGAIQSK